MDHCRVVPQLHGAATTCELLPDDTLASRAGTTGTTWKAEGDHAGFRFGAPIFGPGLAAGWYEWHANIECLDGTLTLPSLRLTYAPGAVVSGGEVPLPDPSASGDMRALVLFKYPTTGLHFCPGVWAARFRLRGCSLRRVSRLTALRMMLCGTRRGGALRSAARRLPGFLAKLLGKGLRRATDEVFSDYLADQRPRGLTEYDVWTRKYDTFTPARLATLGRRAQTLPGAPFSILMTVQGGSVETLRRRIDGVCGQQWGNWELCIAAEVSCDAAIRHELAISAARDPRIRLAPELANDSAAAFRQALDMVGTRRVIVAGEDVVLRRHALLELAALQQRFPHVAFAYADEDRIDGKGRRHAPRFKPAWNPDLLRSQNYIGALAMVDADLLRKVGGLRGGYDGDGLHDLFLRCTEPLERTRVSHVPRILYHLDTCSALASSTDAGGGTTSLRAVEEHLGRLGVHAAVAPGPDRTLHVRWPIPSPGPKISLVIPTRDRVDLLRTCVESVLARTTWPHVEIVVVDNGSEQRRTHDYLEQLRKTDRVRVLQDDRPFNYAAINNRAVAQCDGELVCLLNNDIEVISPDWLEEMAGHALRPEVGAVGAMLYYPNETIQHAGVIVGMHGVADHIYAGKPRGWSGQGGRASVTQELSAVTAACLLIRRAAWLEVGGMDERLAVAFNDVDLCLRLREHGYHNIWTPHAELYHHESASRGRDDMDPERRARYAGEIAYMRERWPAMLRDDPAYNPNLSLHPTKGELAFPPRDA